MRLLRTAPALGLAMLAACPALAADLAYRSSPLPAPLLAPDPAFSWTGFYAGVNAGYGIGVPDVVGVRSPAFTGRFTVPGKLQPSGITGGIQAGYNYQTGAFVLGVEGDLNLGGLRDSIVDTVISAQSQDRLFGSLRARVGVVSMERLLVYGTLGYGFLQNRYLVRGGVATPAISATSTFGGYAAGGGLEYAFTDHLSVKLESIYHSVGKKVLANANQTASTTATPSLVNVRVGVNYRH